MASSPHVGLSAPPAGPPVRRDCFLVLHVNGQSRAVPIRQLRDVAQAAALQRVHGGAAWVRGAVPLRGGRVPVVDLAMRMGRSPTALTESSCVVIADVEARGRSLQVGLLADEESRVTSARLPRWAVLEMDDLLCEEDLSAASKVGPDEAGAAATWPPLRDH